MQAKAKIISKMEFWFVGNIDVKRTADGTIFEYNHELPEQISKNKHAQGPFCKFNLPAAPNAPGVYAIFINEEIKYIGECIDLSARFGSGGYGHISPRNLHIDGQSTNCKLNSRILSATKSGDVMQVWFHSTDDHKTVESLLLKAHSPIWNNQGISSVSKKKSKVVKSNIPSKTKRSLGRNISQSDHKNVSQSDFKNALNEFLLNAELNNLPSIQLTSKTLHLGVGSYPGLNHRMPTCCRVMKDAMQHGDKIIAEPPKGNGATLKIEYQLPRMNSI